MLPLHKYSFHSPPTCNYAPNGLKAFHSTTDRSLTFEISKCVSHRPLLSIISSVNQTDNCTCFKNISTRHFDPSLSRVLASSSPSNRIQVRLSRPRYSSEQKTPGSVHPWPKPCNAESQAEGITFLISWYLKFYIRGSRCHRMEEAMPWYVIDISLSMPIVE